MTNVLKHAGAGRVVITLNRMRGYLILIVEDDGKGFESDESAERSRQQDQREPVDDNTTYCSRREQLALRVLRFLR